MTSIADGRYETQESKSDGSGLLNQRGVQGDSGGRRKGMRAESLRALKP